MLLFINLKKEFKMLRQLLVIPLLLITFSVAQTVEESNVLIKTIPESSYTQRGLKEDNIILQLKLKVSQLEAKNSELERIIEDFSRKKQAEASDEFKRQSAISQLKRDLRSSRLNQNTSLRSTH